MSRNGGTYLAVRSRQWVGGRLALNSAGLMFVAAAAAVGWTVSEASTTSETSLFLASWSYSSVELVYTYPPILLWVGILTTLVSAPIHTPFDAIRTAEGHGRVGVRRTPDREAARNLTRQLHARGWAV